MQDSSIPRVNILDRIKQDGGKLQLTLTVFTFWDEESQTYVGLVPSIHVSSYADTEEECYVAVQEAIDICINSWIASGALHSELEKFGWTLQKSVNKGQMDPILNDNLSNISKLRSFHTEKAFAVC